MTQAYPLQWPHGWPRTPPSERSSGHQFRQGKPFQSQWNSETQKYEDKYVGTKRATFAVARDKLYAELERLGAEQVIISTNHKPDVRGVPIESKRAVVDDGVAVYFRYREKSMVMACDRFDNAAANMRSLGLAIDALRQLERHGGGTMMEKAFTGFEALPAPDDWRQVLGLNRAGPISREDLLAKWRSKAKTSHPDVGGDPNEWHRLQRAYEQAMEAIRE